MARLPKPSAAARWILTLGITGVLVAVGYYQYDQLMNEQSQLLESIAQSDQTIQTLRDIDLADLEAEVADLERRSQSIQARMNALSSHFRTYTHSIEGGEDLYRLADESEVVIEKLQCTGPKSEDIGGMTLEYYTFTIDATAEVPPQLLNFLLKISELYESTTIQHVDMSLPKPDEEGAVSGTSSLTIELKMDYLPQEVV